MSSNFIPTTVSIPSTTPFAPPAAGRQTFYPDARRLYEEIERFGLADHGTPVELWSIADFDFFRAAPSGGYTADPDSERLGQDFFGADSPPTVDEEVEILARIKANLVTAPLAGFVCEGMSPFGMADPTKNAALSVAIFAGMPVVRTGGGNTGGMAYRADPTFISGNNLTATKARMLLMAAILKLGALPPAADPFNATSDERAATEQAVARYQTLFDTH
ncbi:hypothetical protein [Streptomyces sporangiiformans]|uniref:hypothetical protein n=1 Tax=Streptomyces sporangiiformans TaxID=2315329 RepID=UPI0019693AF9|nr:hypothetical protein [Streptomyces sporangiiformans]